MHTRASVVLITALLGGCSGAAKTLVARYGRVPEVCPNGVMFFASPKRVPGKYREVALFPIKDVLGRDEALLAGAMYRRQAGGLGANGIILTSSISRDEGAKVIGPALGNPAERRGMAVAIDIPADSSRVAEICHPAATAVPGQTPVASADDEIAAPQELLLVSRAVSRSRANRSAIFRPLRARIRPFDLSAHETGALSRPAAIVDLRDSASFIRNQDVRSALTNLERLKIVTEAEEVHPGLVRLSMGEPAQRARMEYHIGFLHGSYLAALPYGAEAVVELWSKGAKMGEYTRGGLVVGSEPR